MTHTDILNAIIQKYSNGARPATDIGRNILDMETVMYPKMFKMIKDGRLQQCDFNRINKQLMGIAFERTRHNRISSDRLEVAAWVKSCRILGMSDLEICKEHLKLVK